MKELAKWRAKRPDCTEIEGKHYTRLSGQLKDLRELLDSCEPTMMNYSLIGRMDGIMLRARLIKEELAKFEEGRKA